MEIFRYIIKNIENSYQLPEQYSVFKKKYSENILLWWYIDVTSNVINKILEEKALIIKITQAIKSN